LRPGIT
jgi:hypothetical protein